MNHTPGPWEVQKLNTSCHAGTIPITKPGWGVAGRESKLIASVCGKAGEQESNAHLIAAAPDMLEALETIMDIGDKACRDIARAAIRKARGE